MKDELMGMTGEFTSESVGEGHPDKVCDFIADTILDAYLEADPNSRVACEVLCKEGTVVLAGEITSRGQTDLESQVREGLSYLGYDRPEEPFCSDTVKIVKLISRQAPEIAGAVAGESRSDNDLGAGDQGMMFGYATDETRELMPLPILLAHKITRTLSEDRKSGRVSWLRPDAKAQVTVVYENGKPIRVRSALVSTQHAASVDLDLIRQYVVTDLLPRVLGEWNHNGLDVLVNPSGSFIQGGPSADCGVTGRKIIADTYGGFARHGGGAFSGKDPTKVDRSGAYFCRFAARQLVRSGICNRAEVRVAYAIGVSQPVSIDVETFGSGSPEDARQFLQRFDFRPGAIIQTLGLRRPIYAGTSNYGHFGRPGLPWEK